MSKFADDAAFFVSMGWRVFPLQPRGKVPFKGTQGFKDASDDAEVIDRWGKQYPSSNIGIATGAMSSITVIDIDPRNGGDATVRKLAEARCPFPLCPEARTGNGGRHLFFAYNRSVKAGPAKLLGPGIDIKTDGGYIVAVASVIDASPQGPGGPYSWVRKPTTPWLPHLPPWLLQRLAPPPEKRNPYAPKAVVTGDLAEKSLEGMVRALATAGEGNRNNILNWAAFNAGVLVKEKKLDENKAKDRLVEAGLDAGLTRHEIEATLASGLRAGLGGNR